MRWDVMIAVVAGVAGGVAIIVVLTQFLLHAGDGNGADRGGVASRRPYDEPMSGGSSGSTGRSLWDMVCSGSGPLVRFASEM